MSSQRIQTLAKRVIQQVIADRRTLAMIVFLPMLLLTIVGVLIRVEPEGIQIGIVNQDIGAANINLGERLITILQDNPAFTTEVLSAEEAQDKIMNGELDAVITLPADFTQHTMTTRQPQLQITYEGSNPTISERLSTLFDRMVMQAVGSMALNSENVTIQPDFQATYLHGGAEFDTLDYMAPALIGVFVFFFVFILTCISFLRERLSGTLERLWATPIRSIEIIVGYMLGFLLFGLLQGLITLLFTVFALKIHYTGNLLNVFIVEILLVITSVNLGIFLSTFARNEFQVLQFIPLVITTQVFLGGVFWAIEDMPKWLQPLAYLMPLTHATNALREIMLKGADLSAVAGSLAALVAISGAVILLSAQTAGRVRV